VPQVAVLGLSHRGATGGSPEKLLSVAIMFPFVTLSLGTSNGNTILRVLDEVYEIPPNGKATILAKSSCPLYAMAVSDEYLYVSAETSNDGTYEVLRMPL
jgi:hypothetical protein